MSQCSTVEAE